MVKKIIKDEQETIDNQDIVIEIEEQETIDNQDIVIEIEEQETIKSQNLVVETKEQEIQTSKYTDGKLSEKELIAAKALKMQFQEHLKAKFGLVPDYTIRSTIPTGLDLLDTLMGGGAGTGLVQIIGPPGAGKSALAAKIIAAGQKKYGKLFNSIYVDGEDSTDKRRLYNLGVRQPVMDPYTNISIEKVFNMIDGMCTFKEEFREVQKVPWLCVWDSIANTQPEAALKTNDPNSVTGLRARMLAHLLPKYIPLMNQYNIGLVAVNQLRDKIDMGIFKTAADLKFLSDKKIPGGQASLFNSIQIIYMRQTGDVAGEYGFYGAKVSCKAIKNKLFTPNIKFELIYSFETGFNNLYTNHELLKKTKRISVAGPWCTLSAYPEKKFSQKGLSDIYEKNENFRRAFDDEVKDVLKTEYLDVYASANEDIIE
jgi:RecA/RadA recombinase